MRQPKKRSEAWRVCASGGSKKGAHYAAVRSDAALSETRADSAVMLLILAKLVSRFRSSQTLAAHSHANFGIKGH